MPNMPATSSAWTALAPATARERRSRSGISGCAIRLVEPGEGIGLGQGADIPGAVLLTGGLMLGVYTLLEAGEQGWGSAPSRSPWWPRSWRARRASPTR